MSPLRTFRRVVMEQRHTVWIVAIFLFALVGALIIVLVPALHEESSFSAKLVHWVAILAVLGIEIYVIRILIKELAELRRTQDAIHGFKALFGRAHYLSNIANGIRDSREEVLFTTASMHASWNDSGQEKILMAAKKRGDKGVYRHRGLVAERFGALPGAIELLFTCPHIELRITKVLSLSRLRFVVIDREQSILGVASEVRDMLHERLDGFSSESPSQDSFVLQSTMLAESLAARFETLWEGASDLFDYLNDYITECQRSKPDLSPDDVRQWLGADYFALDDAWLEERSSAFRKLRAGDKEEHRNARPSASTRDGPLKQSAAN